jgi:hypothetical protein
MLAANTAPGGGRRSGRVAVSLVSADGAVAWATNKMDQSVRAGLLSDVFSLPMFDGVSVCVHLRLYRSRNDSTGNHQNFQSGMRFRSHSPRRGKPTVSLHVTELRRSGIWTVETGDRPCYQLMPGRAQESIQACHIRLDHAERQSLKNLRTRRGKVAGAQTGACGINGLACYANGRVYDSGGGTKQKRAAPSTLMLPATLTKLWQSTGSPAAFGVSRIMMSSGTFTHGPSIHWRLPSTTSGKPKRAHQPLPRLSASVVWQSNCEQQLVWAGDRTCGRRRLLYQGSSCGLLQSCPNAALVRRAAHGGIENARTATNKRAAMVVISINQAGARVRLRSTPGVTRSAAAARVCKPNA